MALNYLREGTGAAKWIAAGSLRIAAAQVEEGATVETAAARVGISVNELEDYLDRAAQFSNSISRFATSRARNSAKPDPPITEVEIDSLLRGWMSGNRVQWSREDYVKRIRQELLDYVALADDQGNQVRATAARRAVAELRPAISTSLITERPFQIGFKEDGVEHHAGRDTLKLLGWKDSANAISAVKS